MVNNPAAPAIGTTFRPSPTQLIECYLRPKIAGELHHSAACLIKDADVYSAAPYDLVAQHASSPPGIGDGDHGEWYFFSPVDRLRQRASRRTRRSRTVGGGDGRRWHTEAGRKPVEGSAGGYKTTFSYKETSSSSGITTKPGGWLMVEYSIEGCDIVICKIYKSPRRPAVMNVPPSCSCTASSSSTFTRRLQETEGFLMTDDGDAQLAPIHSQPALAHYPYFNSPTTITNASQGMGTRCTPATPPLLTQGTGCNYPARQHVAAAGQGGAGHPVHMDDLSNHDAVLAHADHAVLPSQHLMLPSAAAIVANQPMLIGTDDVVIHAHIASTSSDLPNLELNEFAFDDLWWY